MGKGIPHFHLKIFFMSNGTPFLEKVVWHEQIHIHVNTSYAKKMKEQ